MAIPLGTLTANGVLIGEGTAPIVATAVGTSGQVLTSNGAGSDPTFQTLYSEGSWTPVLGGAGGTSGQTYSNQVGRYVKIGKMVVLWYYIILTAKGTITGALQIQGFPFTSDGFLAQGIATNVWGNLATTQDIILAYVNTNATTCNLRSTTVPAVSNNNDMSTSDLTDTSFIIGQLSYRATS